MGDRCGSSEIMAVRTGEPDKSYFRSDRFAQVNSSWFFSTREDTMEGPFATRQDAESAVKRYIKLLNADLFTDSEMGNINGLHIKK